MPLTIRYTDTRNTHNADCDPIQEKAIRDFIDTLRHPLMIAHSDAFEYDLIHIDLRDESIEEVHCYRRENCVVTDQQIVGARITSFGGAIAWNIYRQIAEIWPEINYHISGRPAVIL